MQWQTYPGCTNWETVRNWSQPKINTEFLLTHKTDADEDTFALPKGELIKTISYNSALVEDCPNEGKEYQNNIQRQLSVYN